MLDDLLEDPEMTSPDLDFDDFQEASKEWMITPDGHVVYLAGITDAWILMYRKDLPDFPVPTDNASMEAAAAAVHNPPDMYGWVARGLPNPSAPWPANWRITKTISTVAAAGSSSDCL